VWALTNKNDGQYLITGGVDSTLLIWEDTTEAEEARLFQEKEATIQKEQDLSNYIQRGDFKKAILLAIALDKPMKVYELFKLWLENGQGTCPLIVSLFIMSHPTTNSQHPAHVANPGLCKDRATPSLHP
jgi:U3 small nucleolar RNA-associated protein 13